MLKGWEPRLTGMAYTANAVYLVEVVAELSADHVGRLLYLAHLFRHDPDYRAHQEKRVHLIMLARSAAPSQIDFARSRRVRVVVLGAGSAAVSTTEVLRNDQAPAVPRGRAED
jgi:hypothetical protein